MSTSQFYKKYVSTKQINHITHYNKESPYYDHIINEHLHGLPKTAFIVDLGCGYGELLAKLKERGFSIVRGVDISNELIEIAHSLGTPEALLMGVEEYLTTLEDASVNAIIAKDIFEHLQLDELNRILSLCHQKLINGGFLIGHVPNGEGIFGMKIYFGDVTHRLAFTKKSLHQLMSFNGYTNIVCSEDICFGKGLKAKLRFIAWKVLTIPKRVLHWIESGAYIILLSQNITFKAKKG